MARNPAITAFIEKALNYEGDECLIWPFGSSRGYAEIICERVHGPCPPPTSKHEWFEVAHSCGNGHLGCVNRNHLRWATRRENMQDSIKHGTRPRGSAVASAKLTEDDVRVIRSSTLPRKQIAAQFGIHERHVDSIRRRAWWGWLP
ncbi:HNH endonuclease [Rhizobiales bacterium GAS191]|nr:HNH endonuclease [Rhizobiales bacterium GAS191]